MRAVLVNSKEKIVRLGELPEPDPPRKTEVRLRVLEVGLCGTDREIRRFEYGAPPPKAEEFVLGHEALAEVEAVGDDVASLRPGDLVVPMVRRPCASPRCPACRAQRQDFCTTGEYTERGILRANGYLSELTLEEERFLVPVPQALRDVAVLVEPLSIISKAAEQYAVIQERLGFEIPRPRGLVLGAGPVGLLAAMTLRACEFETFVFSRQPEDDSRAELVRSFGASYVSSTRTSVERLPERIGRVDLVFEAVGAPEVAWGALPILAANGTCIFSGVPTSGKLKSGELGRWMQDLVLENQLLFGTVNAGRGAYERAVTQLERFMALFPDAVRALIQRGPLDQATRLLEQRRGIKDVITLTGS